MHGIFLDFGWHCPSNLLVIIFLFLSFFFLVSFFPSKKQQSETHMGQGNKVSTILLGLSSTNRRDFIYNSVRTFINDQICSNKALQETYVDVV